MDAEMATTRTPPGRWVDAGLQALAAGGPEAVRIEPLAQQLGVTKGGFYWHFKDRTALLAEVLDRWERESLEEVIARVEDSGGDARQKLRRLFSLAAARPDLLRADLAIRDWARRDRTVADRLRGVDNRRMSYLRTLFGEFCDGAAEVEARCLLVCTLWIGNHFFGADHVAGQSREGVVETALGRLLS
jgi:AcrR family transcriptional regulator